MQRSRLICAALAVVLLFPLQSAYAQGDNLSPKYGPLPLTKGQTEAKETFIAAMDEEYHGDRTKASLDMAARGWQYLAAGDRDSAMRRFNQAWLLKNDNGTALWGMAAVEASNGKFDESLKLFAEAEQYADEVNLSVDHAKAIGMVGVARHDGGLIKDAFDRFGHIYEKAPQNTNNLQDWAMTLYMVGKYPEAWEKVKLAEATPDKGKLDPRFLAALQAKMPRPQN